MSEISAFGLWVVVSGLAARQADNDGHRILMWCWRIMFVLNAICWVAAVVSRLRGDA